MSSLLAGVGTQKEESFAQRGKSLERGKERGELFGRIFGGFVPV